MRVDCERPAVFKKKKKKLWNFHSLYVLTLPQLVIITIYAVQSIKEAIQFEEE